MSLRSAVPTLRVSIESHCVLVWEDTIGSRPRGRSLEPVRHHHRVHPGPLPTVVAADIPDDATILDVREDDEWAAGHIAGSVHVPLSELPARAADIPDADPLVVVCKVGARSAQVAAWLARQGRGAVNLAGGLDAWAGAGRPLTTDDGTPGMVV
jgi:rhodanese-related sulfurtransferase